MFKGVELENIKDKKKELQISKNNEKTIQSKTNKNNINVQKKSER